MDGNVLLNVLLVLFLLVALAGGFAVMSLLGYISLRFAWGLVHLIPPWKEPFHRWWADLQKKPFRHQVAVYFTVALVMGAVGFILDLIAPGWAD